MLKQLTKTVLEIALGEQMTERLGYEKRDLAGAGTSNICNGTRSKTVLTENTGKCRDRRVKRPGQNTGRRSANPFPSDRQRPGAQRLHSVPDHCDDGVPLGHTHGELTVRPRPLLLPSPPSCNSMRKPSFGFTMTKKSDCWVRGLKPC